MKSTNRFKTIHIEDSIESGNLLDEIISELYIQLETKFIADGYVFDKLEIIPEFKENKLFFMARVILNKFNVFSTIISFGLRDLFNSKKCLEVTYNINDKGFICDLLIDKLKEKSVSEDRELTEGDIEIVYSKIHSTIEKYHKINSPLGIHWDLLLWPMSSSGTYELEYIVYSDKEPAGRVPVIFSPKDILITEKPLICIFSPELKGVIKVLINVVKQEKR